MKRVMGLSLLLTQLVGDLSYHGEPPEHDLDKAVGSGENWCIRSKREDHTMELPQVNPIGLTEIPAGFQARRRRYSRTARVLATAVLALFVLVVTVTTVVSLGAYCLTLDASNTSGLPQSDLRP